MPYFHVDVMWLVAKLKALQIARWYIIVIYDIMM
jgi:hypothetical protein